MEEPSNFVGRVVAGSYRIEAVLGSGGMGVVFRAVRLSDRQRVALKSLRSVALPEAEATRRFMREARATMALTSPHTVRLYGVEELAELGLTLVMEHLEGWTLRDLLEQKGGTLPEALAIDLTIQACRSLGEAHRQGIVHRDIKPANLFVVEGASGPELKVLDFGLVRVLDDTASAPLTASNTALGTPRYMAPEQWSGSKVDTRADLYSLGVVFYQMLTGKVPHEEVPLVHRLGRLLLGVPSPREVKPQLSEDVARIALRALRPVPEERYQTAGEFEAALVATQRPSQSSLTPATVPGPRGAVSPPTVREPELWDQPTRLKQKPAFDVNVYTGARMHAPEGMPRRRLLSDTAPVPATATAAGFGPDDVRIETAVSPSAETRPFELRPRTPAVTLRDDAAPDPPSRPPRLATRDATPEALAATAPAPPGNAQRASAPEGGVVLASPPPKPSPSMRGVVVAVAVAVVAGVTLAFLLFGR